MWYSGDMAKPPQTSEAEHRVVAISLFQYADVGDLVLPGHSKDAPQTANMESVESVFLPSIGSPCFATKQQCAEDTRLVNSHLHVDDKELVGPHSLVQHRYSSRDHANPFVQFTALRQVAVYFICTYLLPQEPSHQL